MAIRVQYAFTIACVCVLSKTLMLVTGLRYYGDSDQTLFNQVPCVNSGGEVNVRLLQVVILAKG